MDENCLIRNKTVKVGDIFLNKNGYEYIVTELIGMKFYCTTYPSKLGLYGPLSWNPKKWKKIDHVNS